MTLTEAGDRAVGSRQSLDGRRRNTHTRTHTRARSLSLSRLHKKGKRCYTLCGERGGDGLCVCVIDPRRLRFACEMSSNPAATRNGTPITWCGRCMCACVWVDEGICGLSLSRCRSAGRFCLTRDQSTSPLERAALLIKKKQTM